MKPQAATLGAMPLDSGRCAFRLWAPKARRVDVRLVKPAERLVPMQRDAQGYHFVLAENVAPGCDYFFRLDGKLDRPDPASRWQPGGVHGPSRVPQAHFAWTDAAWFGPPLRDYVIYELHVGTFSGEGTFDGVIARLPELKDLGITAVELMPVAQFPGKRNWGYDGVCPFAVQDSYGGPDGLMRLVDAAHAQGLAVVLDVVYNHLGPEGNYLGEFAPYFTDRYHTPWGPALNFDGPDSAGVRRFFIENALYWQTEFHIDALRLDAVHAIRDFSAVPFLEELAATCHRQAQLLNRPFHLIAESDLNMARHILPQALGGYGLDAQWSDDFHHSLHVLLTGEQAGYYADFSGVAQFAKVWREGYAYTGQYSRYRRLHHGSNPRRASPRQFVVCAQNHDQVGNRMLGDRLSATLGLEPLKLAAAAVLLSPFIPLLFMGEEYGETAPFLFFVNHSDVALLEAVRRGRLEEFTAFAWQGEFPDPSDEATFRRSRLNHTLAKQERHRTLWEFYRHLLALRKGLPAIAKVEKETLETTAFDRDNLLVVRQWAEDDEVLLLFNFAREARTFDLPCPPAEWRLRLDSADTLWGGPGSTALPAIPALGHVRLDLRASSCALYQKVLSS